MSLRLDLEPTELTLDRSIPCGLILNELITNALKYAYPNGNGEIVVSLSSRSGDVTLRVSDSGAGLPADFDLRKSKSLGMTIVQALTKQLHGKLEVGPPPGGEPTAKVVRAIVRGLDRRSVFLLPSWRAWLVVALARWLPAPFDWIMCRWAPSSYKDALAQRASRQASSR